MKIKDFFAKVKDQGKLTTEGLDAFISALPDTDMPDAVFADFENNFLTPERAATDQRVNKILRGQILDPVDRNMEDLIKAIAEIDNGLATEIGSHVKTTQSGSKQKDTYKQLEALKTGIPGLFAKLKEGGVKTDDPALKQQLADKEKLISELTKKFSDAENEYKGKEKSLESAYAAKLDSYKLDSHLEKLVGGYTFADHLTEIKDDLTRVMLGDLKSKNILKFVENNGAPDISVFEEQDGVLKPKFNGNSPVTIKSLLDEATKKYVKVNNSDGNSGNNTGGQGQDSKTKTFQVDPNRPERRQARSTALE